MVQLPSRNARSSGVAVFGRRYHLATLLGFEIGVDASWLLIAALITWSLAVGWFPAQAPGFSTVTYWVMGVLGALGLFAAVVGHELSHALVARREGVEMRGITLFIFGGVAHMGGEPASPGAEVRVALAGPLASVVIGLLLLALDLLLAGGGPPTPVTATLRYLGAINIVLAAFNLIPAFPLDGGRVLRALLWHWKGQQRSATRIAAEIGAGFGLALALLGLLALLRGNVVGGVWWVLIGMFLRGAARASYRQVLVRQALEGEPVRRFMHQHPHTVSPATTVRDLVENYFYRDYHKLYPVVDDQGELAGGVDLASVKRIPRDRWDRTTVSDIMTPPSEQTTIEADADAVEALSRMQRGGVSRLQVIGGDHHLVGVLTLKDLLRFLAVRVELEP